MANADALDVTVIVPIHNRAATIEATLRSIDAQTVAPARIIVVDDASTDNSVDVVRTLGFANVDVLELKHNLGVGGARNAAAAEATTMWLAFLDGDDTWEPGFLEQVVGAAIAMNATFASSGGTREMLNRPEIVRLLAAPAGAADRTAEFWRIARNWMPIVPSSAVVKRSSYFEAGGFEDDVRWGEEVPFFARLWLNGRFAFVNAPLYRSAQLSGGLSARRRSYRDTVLHLGRLGRTLASAIVVRKPGVRAFAAYYPRIVYQKHRAYVGGVIRSKRRRDA